MGSVLGIIGLAWTHRHWQHPATAIWRINTAQTNPLVEWQRPGGPTRDVHKRSTAVMYSGLQLRRAKETSLPRQRDGDELEQIALGEST